MSIKLNSIAPDFEIITTKGNIHFHSWIEGSWVLLFSHPKDFTPVCTTELSILSKMHSEFSKRNCKIIGLSVDSIKEHNEWKKDIEEIAETPLPFPLIADENLKVAKLYDMLPDNINDTANNRTAVDNLTVRSVFLIGIDKKIKMSLTYPMSSGRDFNEILRVLETCQLTDKHKVATPANWRSGEDVIIVPSINDVDAKNIFPNGWKTIKPYLRKVPDPSKS